MGRSATILFAAALAATAACGDNELACDYDVDAGRCRHPGAPYGHAPAPPEGDNSARLTFFPDGLVIPSIPLEGTATANLTLTSSGAGALTIRQLELHPDPSTSWTWTLTPPAAPALPATLAPDDQLTVQITVHRPDSKAEVLGEIQVAHLQVHCDAYPYETTPTVRVEAQGR